MKNKKNKTFDCVAIKNNIQARLQDEYEGMGVDEIKKCISDKLELSDSPVGIFWRRIKSAEKILQK